MNNWVQNSWSYQMQNATFKADKTHCILWLHNNENNLLYDQYSRTDLSVWPVIDSSIHHLLHTAHDI